MGELKFRQLPSLTVRQMATPYIRILDKLPYGESKRESAYQMLHETLQFLHSKQLQMHFDFFYHYICTDVMEKANKSEDLAISHAWTTHFPFGKKELQCLLFDKSLLEYSSKRVAYIPQTLHFLC